MLLMHPSVTRCVVLSLLLLVGSPPLAALAQAGSDQIQNDKELAEHYYKLGAQLYSRSDYLGALEQFKSSYRYSRAPALLHNMARCHESLGQHVQAIKLYEEYLTSSPSEKELILSRVKNLKSLLASKKAARDPKPKPKPAPKPMPVPKPKPTPKPVVTPAPAPVSPVEDPAPSRPMRIAGWTLVGVGGAGLVAGIVMGALAADKASAMEDLGAAPVEYAGVQSDEDTGRAYQTGQIVGLAAGGALLVGGLTLVLLDYLNGYLREGEERQAWFAPAVTPDGAMLTTGVRF
jgi:tetratricopeptide (TPR) repeat protein